MNRVFETIIVAAVISGISPAAWSQAGHAGVRTDASSSGESSGGAGLGNVAGATNTGNGAGGQVGAGSGAASPQGNVGDERSGDNAPGTSNTASQQPNGRQNQQSTPGRRSGMSGNFNSSGINERPFFNNRGIRNQLNLNDSQFNQLSQLHQQAFQRYSQAVNQLDPNLTQEQRAQQMEQLEGQFGQDFNQNLNSALNSPQLRSRFEQLSHQNQGFSAFNDPSVRKQLNITPDQQRQLRKLAFQWREEAKRLKRVGTNPTGGPPTDARSQYMNQLNDLLTQEQRDSWAQMTGDPYEFQSQNFFPEQGQSDGGDEAGQSQGQMPEGQPTDNHFPPSSQNVNPQQPSQNSAPQNQGASPTPQSGPPSLPQ